MPQMQAIVFDMDGTILHTLPDLARCANSALVQMGFSEHTIDEYWAWMGDGGRLLIERALPPQATLNQRNHTFELWRDLYISSDYSLTKPFPGIVDALNGLRAQNVKIAVLSNKFHEGTCVLAERHFPSLFDAVRGDKAPAPRKPDPTTLLQMLANLGVPPEAAAYVGDSNVDVQTARNAGVRAIGVSWGYDHANPLRPKELDAYLKKPKDLLGIV